MFGFHSPILLHLSLEHRREPRRAVIVGGLVGPGAAMWLSLHLDCISRLNGTQCNLDIRDERHQIRQSIRRGDHDHHRDSECRQILLMAEIPVHSQKYLEARTGHEGQQFAVLLAGPTHFVIV